MKVMKTLAGIVPLILLLGCSNPADNVPAAAVKSAANATGKASDPGGRYFAFGRDSATIEFIGSKITGFARLAAS